MNNYTPQTEDVRNHYSYGCGPEHTWAESRADFDRWLSAHDAEVRAAALAEGTEEPEWEWGVGWRAGWSTRLMGVAHPSRAAAEADVAESNADPADEIEYFLVQRTPQRAEGWWVPVEQGDDDD